MVLAWGGLLSPFITLHVRRLMVCHGQYTTLLWEESFRWLHNAAGPLDIPLRNEARILNTFIYVTRTAQVALIATLNSDGLNS